jgi:hypothetical protein
LAIYATDSLSVKVTGRELSARLYTLTLRIVKIFLVGIINANFCFVSDVGLRDENRAESVRQACGGEFPETRC